MIHKAAYFTKLDNGKVECQLCPLACKLDDGEAGICRSRFASDGELLTSNFGELVTLAVDPIEKKPLYHFYPGSKILSTGPNCCNLGCRHCQNWSISQQTTRTQYVAPEELVAMTVRDGSIGVAFTYTEPMIWYEYIMATAPLLKKAGLKVVLVTNGFINPEPLEDLIKVSDAMNIDLKSINPAFYKKICKGRLEPVKESIQRVAQSDCHLEITNLIIPGKNDAVDELEQLFEFIESISPEIPLHLSAYHPSYEMTAPATSVATLIQAREMALKRLKFVYIGNVRVDGASDTKCPECGEMLITRASHPPQITSLKKGRCTSCGYNARIRM